MVNTLQLLAMSIIWGLTWIAIKTGVESTPPVFFAATRFIAAGAMLLLIFRSHLVVALSRGRFQKVVIVSLLLTTFCYAPIFWGMQHTSSGIAAIVNLSLLPIGLLLIGSALGVETIGRKELAGITLGLVGLGGLYWPELRKGASGEALALIAITIGTFSAAFGAVLSRLWLNDLHKGAASGLITFFGGLALLAISIFGEPISIHSMDDLLGVKTLLSWVFLVLFGSVVAFTLYLHLLGAWGPFRAGLYCFISPVVALAAGFFAFGEQINGTQAFASVLLIGAAAFVVWPKNGRVATDLKSVPIVQWLNRARK